MQTYDLAYKVCVLGDAGVGKSCIIQRFADDVFNENCTSTIGIDFRYKTIQDDGKVIKMEIWDTAGSERYRSVISALFRGLHGVVYVYDVCDRASYDNLKSFWIQELSAKQLIHQEVLKLLVGNKADLATARRAVTVEEAQEYAKQAGMPFLETSAKDGVNVNKAFQMMAAAIREGACRDRSDVMQRGAGQQPLGSSKPIQLDDPQQQGSESKKRCCLSS